MMTTPSTRPAPAGARRRARRILLAGAVALALTEGALRGAAHLRSPYPPGQGPDDEEARLYRASDDPVLEWELAPGAHAITAAGVVLDINRDGFRGADVPRAKPSGVRRVVVLGDSETFGAALPLADTLPAALAAALGQRWQVLNFGVPAYNTRQERVVWRTKASAYAPDVAIIYFVSNDLLPSRLLSPPDLWSRSALVRLVRGVRAYREAHALLGDGADYVAYVRRAFAPGSVAWPANRAHLVAFVREIEATGTRALVVVAPELYGIETAAELAATPYRSFHDALGGLAPDGVAVVDPLPALVADGRPPREYWAASSDHHKNGIANRLVADVVAGAPAFAP